MAFPEEVTYCGKAVEELLECPICLERFRNPKLLPCQHTFCLRCTEKLVVGSSLRCPECRARHTVPPLSSTFFPTNLTIARLLNLPQLTAARPIAEGAAVASRAEGAAVASRAVPQHNVVPTPASASHRATTAMTSPQTSRSRLAEGGGFRTATAEVDNSPSIIAVTPRINYKQKGRPLACFGQSGKGERQFRYPFDVAVSPLNDDIFVTDNGNHRVQVFDKTGVFIKTFGRQGRGHGQFDRPTGIAFNGSSPASSSSFSSSTFPEVIVSDCFNNRVQIFDSNGDFQSAFGSRGAGAGQLDGPCGVACDSMGYIYVCDTDNGRVQVFNASGEFVRQIRLPGGNDSRGSRPYWVAVSADNKMYVSDTDNNRIHVFSTHGEYHFSFCRAGSMVGLVKRPAGLAIDSQGFVVLGDAGNSRVQVFRADGRFFSTFGRRGSQTGQFLRPIGVAILSNGSVVVVDWGNSRVQIM